MNLENTNKPPTLFWIIGWGALLWNAMGIAAYISTVTMSAEMAANLPEAQRQLIENTPAWATGAFAFAVFGGAIGSLLLLFKSRVAYHLFWISLIGIVVQMYHSLFLSNSIEVYGPGGAIMPIMVLLFGIGLVWYSKQAIEKSWIT